MTTTELYNYIIAVVKKEVYGAIKVQMVQDLFNANQSSFFEDQIGRIKQYQAGRPIPPVHLEATQRIQFSLSPFTRTATLEVQKGGFCNIDVYEDFYYGPVANGVSAYQQCGDTPGVKYAVDWLSDSEWNDATSSLIQPPTLRFPIARYGAPFTQQSSKGWIEVMPKELSHVEFKYFRKPKDIVIGGTYGMSGFIPDSTVSGNVDPEWFDIDMKYLIGKTVYGLGMPLDDEAVKQFGITQAEQGI